MIILYLIHNYEDDCNGGDDDDNNGGSDDGNGGAMWYSVNGS